MQIRLTVVDPLGPPSEPWARAASCDVLVTAPAGTALASVASALASVVAGDGGSAPPERGPGRESGGAVVLYAGDQRLDARRCTLGEPPLVDGAVLALGTPAEPEPHPEADEVAAQLHVVAGPDAGGVHLLHGGQITIGRSADADVPLDDPDVSRLHCAVTVEDDGRIAVADLNSTNGTTLSGTRLGTRPVRLAPGALLRIGESALRLTPPGDAGARVGTTPDGEGHVRVSVAEGHPAGPGHPADKPDDTEDTEDTHGRRLTSFTSSPPSGETHHAYGSASWGTAGGESESRSTRNPAQAAAEPLVPGQGRAPHIESRKTPGTAGTSRVSDRASRRASDSAGDTHGAGFSVPGQVSRTPAVPHARSHDEGGRQAEAEASTGGGRKGTPLRGTDVPQGARKRGGLSKWARRLTGGRAEPETTEGEAYDDEGAVYEQTAPEFADVPAQVPESWPDPATLLLTALGPGPRLWERGPGHPEALTVRLGTADRAAPDGSGLLPAVPVTAGLREVGALGLAGPRARLAGLARAVVAQLTALHSPEALEIVLISTDRARTAEERTAEWSWLGWLPHLRPGHGQDCRLLLAYDREQATARTDELLRRLEDHDTETTARRLASGGVAPDLEDRGTPQGAARRPSWARPDDPAAEGADRFAGPYTVVVVDGDPGGAAIREAVARLAQEGPRAGIHVVCLAETEAASPASPVTETYEAACAVSPPFRECGAVALLSGDVATAVHVMRVARAGDHVSGRGSADVGSDDSGGGLEGGARGGSGGGGDARGGSGADFRGDSGGFRGDSGGFRGDSGGDARGGFRGDSGDGSRAGSGGDARGSFRGDSGGGSRAGAGDDFRGGSGGGSRAGAGDDFRGGSGGGSRAGAGDDFRGGSGGGSRAGSGDDFRGDSGNGSRVGSGDDFRGDSGGFRGDSGSGVRAGSGGDFRGNSGGSARAGSGGDFHGSSGGGSRSDSGSGARGGSGGGYRSDSGGGSRAGAGDDFRGGSGGAHGDSGSGVRAGSGGGFRDGSGSSARGGSGGDHGDSGGDSRAGSGGGARAAGSGRGGRGEFGGSAGRGSSGLVGQGSVAAVDAVSLAWAERFARALAPLRTDGAAGGRPQRVSAPLPQAARLLDELGLARATPASLMARWADAADDAETLGGRAWAVLGAGPRGPVGVDLAAEGPHLLIEGPPGSGRTELLRAVVASLAAAERPDRLGIVLMDGRDGTGGSAGGAPHGEGLRVCTDLPHVTTHLTANDPVRMREFAQSLSAELKRRAELLGRVGFGEWHNGRELSGRIGPQRSKSGSGAHAHGSVGTGTGTASGEGAGDLDSPPSSTMRLRPTASRRRTETPPLARLVVVVDDLDALVSPPLGSPGRPSAGSVVRALEAVAREGERLGVHLVAAAGVGGRTAETELARGAALRVVLDAPAPGPDEPAAGRGRLSGADGRGVPFQGGRVTGRIPRTATLRPTVAALDWQRMGDPPARRPVRELGNGPTDLALLASALERAARSVSAAEVPSLL
ncbi:FHA domain-containing protein [Streptomyces sp. NPDC047042]|uniref:FHA domain-containing protein n=1 Tax=Streptomyces sp. NPDC047042 TaxID=3154807 RepID=UPI0033C60DED